MLNIPPHLEACRPRGLFSIFHGTSSPVARRCPRASDLVLSAEHAFLLYERPGLHLQSGASAVGGVLHGARRSSRCFSFGAICDFNPRAPCGARRRVGDTVYTLLNFNPRTPCGVRPHGRRIFQRLCRISIHAPRAGCDRRNSNSSRRIMNFNPRTPCGVRRLREFSRFRGAYFNPRTPCGVRRDADHRRQNRRAISIHAPRAGCDNNEVLCKFLIQDFNPRTPCGVRRAVRKMIREYGRISIHAPRAGCD